MMYETLLTMGTKIDFLLPTETDSSIWSEVRDELLRLNSIFNRFDPKSEVSQVNRGGPVVSYTLREAIALGI